MGRRKKRGQKLKGGPKGKQINDKDELGSFFELVVHGDTIRILSNKSITTPTAIQSVAIPLMRQHKDVLVLAKPGSGKTFAYLISLFENLWMYFCDLETHEWEDPFTSAIIIAPTSELCQQISDDFKAFLEEFSVEPKLALLKSTTDSQLDALLAGKPDIIISTPDCVLLCLAKGFLRTRDSRLLLRYLILDEIDVLLSNGYGYDLKSIVARLPQSCQCLLFSDTPSADVGHLKSFAANNPYIVTLSEAEDVKVQVFSYNVEHFYITCSSHDKLPIITGLLLYSFLCERVVIFTNSIDMSERLRFLIGMFDYRVAAVHPGLSLCFRKRIIKDFNEGQMDQLIVARDEKRTRYRLNMEADVLEQLDFSKVDGVVNFDLPQTAAGYARRVNHTGGARAIGVSLSLVSPEEMCFLKEIRSLLGDNDSKIIAPYRRLTESMMEVGRAVYEMLENPGSQPDDDRLEKFLSAGKASKATPGHRGGLSESSRKPVLNVLSRFT